MSDFFEDADPQQGGRNFVQDDGSVACAEEPTIGCSGLDPGFYAVYVRTVQFDDEDESGGLSCGDKINPIQDVASSHPVFFELTNYLIIYRVRPRVIRYNKVFRVYGLNFGDSRGDGRVRVGRRAHARSATLGLGKPVRITRNIWTSTRIRCRMNRYYSAGGTDYYRYVWVEKDGVKSENYVRVKIEN